MRSTQEMELTGKIDEIKSEPYKKTLRSTIIGKPLIGKTEKKEKAILKTYRLLAT